MSKIGGDTEVDAVAATMAQVSIGERREIAKKLYLLDRMELLRNLVQKLKSTKNYFSRHDRDLILLALRTNGENVSSEVVAALEAPTNLYIPAHLRNDISVLVSDVLDSGKLDKVEPLDDNQRFRRMVDGNEISLSGWNDMVKLGVVSCTVQGARKVIELSGIKPSAEFFDGVKKMWGFTDPEHYFHYVGETTKPDGTLDMFVMAGAPVDYLPAVPNLGKRLSNGTIGAVLD